MITLKISIAIIIYYYCLGLKINFIIYAGYLFIKLLIQFIKLINIPTHNENLNTWSIRSSWFRIN